jgi:galactokinase
VIGATERAVAAFAEAFGGAPDIVVRAPGRVNLIGEHTDYNDGFVLPCAIGPGTTLAARATQSGRMDVVADDFGRAQSSFDAATLPQRLGDWSDYVRSMFAEMAREGVSVPGAQVAIAGDVPRGAGLSSSASLEVATGFAIASLANTAVDPTRIAQLAQRAECDFVGTKCGIMDQLVSARGVAGHALLIDCRSLAVHPVAVPADLAVLIVHSGITRGLVDGAYNERRAQCEAAARHLGVPALRDADLAMLDAERATLDPLAYRRARHVVTENARTLAAAETLEANDAAALGRLMAESHASMRDDFEITTPAIDDLVALLWAAIRDDGGARMTGGGFGGAVVAVVRRDRLDDVIAAVNARYRTPDGKPPLIMVERPSAGVHRL